MEDAYLSIIPPLSYNRKLPKPEEIFDMARESAIKEQSLGNWENAYEVYYLLFQNFTTFGERDEMTVKATALFIEFVRFLSTETKLEKSQVLERDGDDDEALKLDKLKEKVLEDLKKVDNGAMNRNLQLHKIQGQGWFEDCEELQPKHQENDFELSELRHALNQTEFHFAAMKPSKSLDYLLQHQKELRKKDFFERTALHYATRTTWIHELEKEKYSLTGFRDIDAMDCDGMTALHTAAESGNADMVELLLREDASKNKRFQNRTSLHIAAAKGHVDVVQKLIDARADTTIKAPRGRTALHIAVLGCHNDVISKLLEEEGFDTVDGWGRTALHLAAARGCEPIVRLLLKKAEGNKTKESMLASEDM
jgi:hypothetical protein